MKKILRAGLVGGLVVFLWGTLSHTLLPIGQMGLKPMPVNSPLLDSMKSALAEEGLYYYPGREADRSRPKPRMRSGEPSTEWVDRSPALSPEWRRADVAGAAGIQLATDMFGALLLAYLLVAIAGSTGAQVPMAKMLRISAVAGLFAWVSISIAHWNWYGLPCAFILAEGIDQIVGWTLAGSVMALLWRRAERRAILQAERHWES